MKKYRINVINLIKTKMKINTPSDVTCVKCDATGRGTPLNTGPSPGLAARGCQRVAFPGTRQQKIKVFQLDPEKWESLRITLISTVPPEVWDHGFQHSCLGCGEDRASLGGTELPGTSTSVRWVLAPKCGILASLDAGLRLYHSWRLSQPPYQELWNMGQKWKIPIQAPNSFF